MSGWDQRGDIDDLNARLDGDDERINIDPQLMLDVLGVFAAVVGVVILLGIAVLVWQVAL